jgi:hypothetical protein
MDRLAADLPVERAAAVASAVIAIKVDHVLVGAD